MAGRPDALARPRAALIASIVHYGEYSIRQIKEHIASQGVRLRMVW